MRVGYKSIYTLLIRIIKQVVVVFVILSNETTKLPLIDLFRLVFRSIKLRFFRITLVIIAITTSIAYMVSLELLAPIIAVSDSPSSTQLYTTALSITASLVALTGTTNSLLILISERYQEIGTMKSFGARDIHIFQLLVLESIMLSFIGALIGYAIGFGIGSALGGRGNPLYLFLKSLLIAVTIGLLATLYPSYKASRIPPVEALRTEV